MSAVNSGWFTQRAQTIRLEWGLAAARWLAGEVACVVVVDVMSFSTCVSLACNRDACILPWRWRDDTAAQFAQAQGALLASTERQVSGAHFSLSPSSLTTLPPGSRLVLPSPNGSTVAFSARESGAVIFSACLRNLSATVAAIRHFDTILIIPCGERWPDGSLRPALEDYVAAGGLVAALADRTASPEAQAAAAVWQQAKQQAFRDLATCASAQELRQRGFADDVELCLMLDADARATRLNGAAFCAVTVQC